MSGGELDLDAVKEAALADDSWWCVPALALVAEVRRLREVVRRVEVLTDSDALDACECGHGLDEHNGLGCYARLSYTPLVTCACVLTDDRTHADLARLNLRAALTPPADDGEEAP